jgi:hypothetical protein
MQVMSPPVCGFKSPPVHLTWFSTNPSHSGDCWLFAFSEDFVSVEVANEFEAGFYKFARFFFRVSYDGGEVVIFEAYELRV